MNKIFDPFRRIENAIFTFQLFTNDKEYKYEIALIFYAHT